MKGRRIRVEFAGTRALYPDLKQPGDYCGPLIGWTADRPAVFFLKPNANDPQAPKRAHYIQHVCSPPHRFTEEMDGTLTIRDSIGDKAGKSSVSDGWHGYLTKGEWHQ